MRFQWTRTVGCRLDMAEESSEVLLDTAWDSIGALAVDTREDTSGLVVMRQDKASEDRQRVDTVVVAFVEASAVGVVVVEAQDSDRPTLQRHPLGIEPWLRLAGFDWPASSWLLQGSMDRLDRSSSLDFRTDQPSVRRDECRLGGWTTIFLPSEVSACEMQQWSIKWKMQFDFLSSVDRQWNVQKRCVGVLSVYLFLRHPIKKATTIDHTVAMSFFRNARRCFFNCFNFCISIENRLTRCLLRKRWTFCRINCLAAK